MKKLIAILLLISVMFMFASCDIINGVLDSLDDDTDTTLDDEQSGDDNDDNDSEKNDEEAKHIYTSFTKKEKGLFTTYIGEIIPFIPNSEYYIEGYYDLDDYENGINFYTIGNTEEEFEAYLELFAGYTLEETFVDGEGDTWYCYVKGDVVVELAYYTYDSDSYVDVYISVESDNSGDNGNDDDPSDYLYTGFTSEENALFISAVGATIPFLANDEYYVEEYTHVRDDGDVESGVNFYTATNTAAEFEAYRELFSSYTFVESYEDSYGDTWYTYCKGDYYVDMSYYLYEEGIYLVDVYAYILTSDSGSGSTPSADKESEWRDAYDCITVAEALDLCLNYVSSPSSSRYYIVATVTEIQDSTYGQLMIEDATGEIMVYGTNNSDGSLKYSQMGIKLEVGDLILIYGTLQNYKGNTKEVQNAWLIDYYREGGAGSGSGSDSSDHEYSDFTSSEKNLFNSTVGFVIPFIPNDEYYVDEYSDSDYGIYGLNFYAYGNTQAEFNAYRALFSSYTYDDSEVDFEGDTWYYYSKGDYYIDMCYYYSDGDYVVDVYVYITDENGGSGSTGGGSGSDYDVITNAGAGLPTASDGVYDIDFKKADKVKDVTDQGYYLDGCPTTGSPAVLVIPVEFSDVTAASKGYSTDVISDIFIGENGYYSVYEYYSISSYGQLNLDITVITDWFRPQYNSSYYYNATYDYYGDEIAIGDQLIIDEALAYYEQIYDLSKFDSDNNGIIDSIVLVNTLDIGEEDFYWAYRYWNVYTDDDGYYYEYDGVSANDYVWASYQFIYESYDEDGNADYSNSTVRNPYTFIHEFGHVLGVDDYYDTAYENDPMGGYDVMDAMIGDHNAYTKFNLGWITTSRLVVTNDIVILTLEDFSKSGDTIILANNWDESLGVYQEYYIVVYYTNNGLNAGDAGYFMRDGIVVYHVNASLYREEYDGTTYYDIYNNNTSPSDEYGTENNLIEYVLSDEGHYTYVDDDYNYLPHLYDDLGNELSYCFNIEELTEDYATITFFKV